MALISNLKTPDDQTFDIRAGAIPYGQVDSTSTATVFTATVPGINELVDGTTVMLKNGVVTSTTNFTINVNGLGAKPVYNNMAAATRDTTIFNVNYTMLFVYDEDRVEGGCWICYRGYNANDNTIGYQLRTNSTAMPASDTARYYKIYFTSADGTKWVPASVNSTNNATTARAVNQRPIDPFGRIAYTSASTNFTAGTNITATSLWSQYNITLGYSFNRTGAALTLTTSKPIYIKCAPQSDGSAIIDAATPYVQDLPTTDDGKIYIWLGIATSATAMELFYYHPVYYYKDGAIRLWTNAAASGSSVDPATATPLMDGTGAVGTSAKYAREDHVHPSDTSKVDVSTTSGSVLTMLLNSAEYRSASMQVLELNGDVPTQYGGVEAGLDSDYNSGFVSLTAADTNDLNHLYMNSTETIIHNVVTPTANGDAANKQYVDNAVSGKQDTLVSGTNIKTVNNNSLLGSGNVSISVPTASTSTPLMDGTASYGSGTSYARSNHVHPTDTSRQATLVSGTNIKTVGGTSLLGSGNIALPTVPTTVSSFTNDAGYLTLATLPIYDGTVTTP